MRPLPPPVNTLWCKALASVEMNMLSPATRYRKLLIPLNQRYRSHPRSSSIWKLPSVSGFTINSWLPVFVEISVEARTGRWPARIVGPGDLLLLQESMPNASSSIINTEMEGKVRGRVMVLGLVASI